MMLRNYERFVIESELVMEMTPKEAPFIPFEESIVYLKQYFEKGNALYEMNNGRISITGKKLVDNGDTITILLVYNDKDGADPSFCHEVTGKIRTEKKQEGEGIAVSAHVVISKTAISPSFMTNYLALVEGVPGLTRKNITSALNSFIKSATNWEYQDNQKKKSCRQLLSMDASASHTLEELFKNGKINGFTAIRSCHNEQLDEDEDLPITIKEESMKMSIKPVLGQKALEYIQKVREMVLGREYSQLRIRYTDNNKRQKSLDMDVRAEDALSKGYSKVTKFELATLIDQCESNIHCDLNTKMNVHLENIRKDNESR